MDELIWYYGNYLCFSTFKDSYNLEVMKCEKRKEEKRRKWKEKLGFGQGEKGSECKKGIFFSWIMIIQKDIYIFLH